MSDTPKFKVPKNNAEMVDRWFDLRLQRLAKQKEVDALEEEEKYLKGMIIDTLPRSSATGISGKLCQVLIVMKSRPEIKNYDVLTEYIAKNRRFGSFALLNRAVNSKTCHEFWEQKKAVPGVIEVPYKDLSYKSLK